MGVFSQVLFTEILETGSFSLAWSISSLQGSQSPLDQIAWLPPIPFKKEKQEYVLANKQFCKRVINSATVILFTILLEIIPLKLFH